MAPKAPVRRCASRAVDQTHLPLKAVPGPPRWPSPTPTHPSPFFLVWISCKASSGMDGCHSWWPCPLRLGVETARPTHSKPQQEGKAAKSKPLSAVPGTDGLLQGNRESPTGSWEMAASFREARSPESRPQRQAEGALGPGGRRGECDARSQRGNRTVSRPRKPRLSIRLWLCHRLAAGV